MNKPKNEKKIRICLALDKDIIAFLDDYQRKLFLPSRSLTANMILRNYIERVKQNAKG